MTEVSPTQELATAAPGMANGQHTNGLFEQLLSSPRLVLLDARLHRVLEAEQAKRETFYATIQEDDKAEFVNGEVIMHSPAKFEHTQVSGLIYYLLLSYVRLHDMGVVGHEKLMVSLTRNDYEPDVCYFGAAKSAAFSADQWKFPAPDLVVEILSDSTQHRDRGVKLEDYAAHEVTEYWIVDSVNEVIEQYLLNGDHYDLTIKASSGELRATAIPGLAFPVRAIFDADVNFATVRAWFEAST